MAKEMMIVFVYDTQYCNKEEDDPIDAVLYFHPGWVSDTQRHALAGQIVGTSHCVKSLFSQPLAITLQSGKFIIREYGRYLLAIGSDRNIPDWVLKNRASLLTSIIKVYHGDLHTVALQMGDRQKFADKLYQIFETYLPVLQYGCHIFQRVPLLTLPKSATFIYMETLQILEYCRKSRGVLGGIILYNNKIVATQLPPGLTSYLTVVDPYRIKSPAETLNTVTPLPLGAQLLAVYVKKTVYESLKKQADVMQELSERGEQLVSCFKKNQEVEREKARDFPQTNMKRDKSLLFTAVPEEDHSITSPLSHGQNSDHNHKEVMPDVVPFTNKPRPRPNKLSLSFKTQKSVEEVEKENENVYTGQTSVCSTPMIECKRLHSNVLSICQNAEIERRNNENSTEAHQNENNSENDKKENKFILNMNTIAEHYINKPVSIRKLTSLIDIQDSLIQLTNKASLTLRCVKPKTSLSNQISPLKRRNKKLNSMTINDPLFPVFRDDGLAISESLFNQYLQQYAVIREDFSKQNIFDFDRKLDMQKTFEGFDSEIEKCPEQSIKTTPPQSNNISADQSRRKSLSLPLKSLSNNTDVTETETEFKRKLTGVQLTPLMEKLSHLAFSDKSSGYGSRVMTPLDITTPSNERQLTFSNDKPKIQRVDSDSDDSEAELDILPEYSSHSEKCALFVSGLQNMALLVLLDTDYANNTDLINNLWETSLNTLGPIEQKCMQPLTVSNESTDYSYLTLDPDWGTVKKGGPWASLDIATMGLIHNDFCEDSELTEVILRNEESVVLGAQCGAAQAYYQESEPRAAGPPPPSDAFAAAPLRARRRMLRDHNLLIM